MSVFNYSFEVEGEDLVLKITGDVKLSRTPDLQESVKDSILKNAQSIKRFVVDLSSVEYIDSSGIGFLIYTKRLSDSEGIAHALRSPSETAGSVIDLMNLKDDFTILK